MEAKQQQQKKKEKGKKRKRKKKGVGWPPSTFKVGFVRLGRNGVNTVPKT